MPPYDTAHSYSHQPAVYAPHHQTALPAVPEPASVDLSGERQPVVWVPGPDGNFVGVPRDMLPAGYLHSPVMPAPPQRDLTPQPLIDPRAQLVLAVGIAAGTAGAGLGWGIGQAAAGIAAVSGSSGLIAALALLLLVKATGRGGSTVQVHHETTVINTNRWFGKSTTTF
ncbi:hypothetical protein [Streptomyces albireticuli]|uniref:Uncharacterized protein n=1 Tax=Streptomyces albireticuli TaxID=1940 RepID=A0A2A2D627_9ACTN|nr:hypothetical protein [Streptomyces albireticuli]MCD9146063.1 hypothetical protein [Streptomyces albireticuli]MCD9165794.1 hypothetical protein [Streptomyces albireticuli]MCD9196012.1 hypothetical protein [Streptomyces albireticuli]PAU46896.1 hypothetical protein CK936_21585 [Streptomyces albireticuli]